MPSETVSFLKILGENGGEMELLRIYQEMVTRRALGFGVKVEDLVYRLKSEGKIEYDSKTEIISSKLNHAKGLCGKPTGSLNLPGKETETNPPRCQCCGYRMEIKNCSSIGMEQLGIYWVTYPVCPTQATK